jgi:hypothetical protein
MEKHHNFLKTTAFILLLYRAVVLPSTNRTMMFHVGPPKLGLIGLCLFALNSHDPSTFAFALTNHPSGMISQFASLYVFVSSSSRSCEAFSPFSSHNKFLFKNNKSKETKMLATAGRFEIPTQVGKHKHADPHDQNGTAQQQVLTEEMKEQLVPFGGSAIPVDKPDKNILGGKGLGLQEMSKIGVDVPPGFTLTTPLCKVFQESNDLPQEMWQMVRQAVKQVEQDTGKTYGSHENPLLFSCRSGAAISMPGMMDTVLNIVSTRATIILSGLFVQRKT